MTKKIGFKEMWEYIEQERYRKIIKSKDEKIANLKEELDHMRQVNEILLKYAPEDVAKDYRNTIND